MPKPRPPLQFSLLLILSFLHLITCISPDLAPLLSFKSASDSSNAILNWNSSTDPCTLPAISCSGNRVTRLVLENLQLQNSFQPLTSLTKLRILSLKNNRFSGSIPDLSNLTSLKLLFLSHNDFSGEFPVSLASMSRLIRVDLSFNNLTGDIPSGLLNGLTNLLTLRLEENRFSGQISGLNVQNLQNFNVSGNMLSGQIPFSLSGFPISAFSNNFRLCGPPLPECSTIGTNPNTPSGAFASPIMPFTVPSSPSILPENMSPTKPIKDHRKIKISPLAAVGIAIGDVLILGLVFLLIYWFFRQNYSKKFSEKSVAQVEKILYSPSPWTHPGYERGKMVFLDSSKKFELEDLLTASAEMLGKGGLGTAYRAILDDGTVVAVKRLKEVCLNLNGKKDFEQQIEVLGRLKHQNLVSLKAYYFAKDEKLLLFDYMENGNLFWLLHGNRGPGRTPLDWTTRLKIAAGAARGLSFIHSSSKSLKLTHGNIKSTNVLIDKTGNARLSDFGLSVFALPSALRSNGYCAPEAVTDSRKYTQKSDVYSFGVLLLELLTGKCPSIVYDEGAGTEYCGVLDLPRWVQSVVREEWTAEVFDLELMRYKDIEEEMVGLLQIAMACSSASSDQRPKMNQVVKLIEELRGVEMSPSPSHATDDSVSDSPSVYESTCAASL